MREPTAACRSAAIIANGRFNDGFNLGGVRVRYQTDRTRLDLLWSQLYAFDTTGGADAAFRRNPVLFGTDDVVQFAPELSAEAYVWWMVAKPFMGWKTQTVTLRGRLFGATSGSVPIDYSVEGGWQTGTGKGIVDSGRSIWARNTTARAGTLTSRTGR